MTQLTPFPYQIEGAEFLASRAKALLADDMGLGKTVQAILACDRLKLKRVLVICPAMLRGNWKEEFERWQSIDREITKVESMSQGGSNKDRRFKAEERRERIERGGVVIVSYDLMAGSLFRREIVSYDKWDVIICDEAHRLKNPTAKRTKALLGAKSDGKHKNAIANHTERLWFLTGTPMPNTYDELYVPLKALGAWEDTKMRFLDVYTTGFRNDFGKFIVTGGRNIPDLKRKLYSVMKRRKKEEVLKDLPPILWGNVSVEGKYVPTQGLGNFKAEDLEEGMRRRWDEYFDPETGEIDDELLSDKGMATIRRYVGMQKVAAVVDMAAEALTLDKSKKLVLFAYHRDVVETLTSFLREEFGARSILGGEASSARERAVAHFQRNDKHRVLVLQITAACEGLTLTAANDVWVVEPSWVPSENAQAVARCHRIGQTKSVNACFFSLDGSIDTAISRALIRKSEQAAKIFA